MDLARFWDSKTDFLIPAGQVWELIPFHDPRFERLPPRVWNQKPQKATILKPNCMKGCGSPIWERHGLAEKTNRLIIIGRRKMKESGNMRNRRGKYHRQSYAKRVSPCFRPFPRDVPFSGFGGHQAEKWQKTRGKTLASTEEDASPSEVRDYSGWLRNLQLGGLSMFISLQAWTKKNILFSGAGSWLAGGCSAS